METKREQLISLLLATLSKDGIFMISEQAKVDLEIYDLLWGLAKDGKQPVAWRAIWALDHATQHAPDLLLPKVQEMYNLLLIETHSGMKRQLFNLILRYPIDINQAEKLLNVVLEWLQNPKEAIAVRANAVRFLYEIYRIEPDFKYELQEVLNRQLYNSASTGLSNIIRNTLLRLNKPSKKKSTFSRKQD